MRTRLWRRNRRVTLLALMLVVVGMMGIALVAGSGWGDDDWGWGCWSSCDDGGHGGHGHGGHGHGGHGHGDDFDFDFDFDFPPPVNQTQTANMNINTNVNNVLSGPIFTSGGGCGPSCNNWLPCGGGCQPPPCGGGCQPPPCSWCNPPPCSSCGTGLQIGFMPWTNIEINANITQNQNH